MFGKKKTTSHNVEVSDRTRKRTSKLTTPDLHLYMETVVNGALPERFTGWKNGNLAAEDVEVAIEAILAIWDELATRQD